MAVEKLRPDTPEYRMSRRKTKEDWFRYEDDVPLALSGAPQGAGKVGHHDLWYSHCMEKDPNRAQQDDGVTGSDWPVPDKPPKPTQGGPVWSTKENK
jgi:hypothetical protein